jgi:tetratricopeptide (TPR) repeat protein
MNKTRRSLIVALIVMAIIGASIYFLNTTVKEKKGASIAEILQHKKDSAAIDKYYALLHEGDKLLRNKNYAGAEGEYKAALAMAKNPDGEIVARGKLARFYEEMGSYEKALDEIDWFLARNLASPGRIRYSEARVRLLKKMRASSANSTSST